VRIVTLCVVLGLTGHDTAAAMETERHATLAFTEMETESLAPLAFTEMETESLAPLAFTEVETESLASRTSSALVDIAQRAIPLVLVETEGEYHWRTRSDTDGIRTVTIGTDHLAAIRRFWKSGRHRSPLSSWPVLQTAVEWDPASGVYTLKRVELGFFRRRIWLIHQLPDADERYGSMGIQIKWAW